MKIKSVTMLLGLMGLSSSYAFNCYFTAAKDNCWLNYSVTISVIDAKTNKTLQTVVIGAGEPWQRIQFNCQPGQNLNFQASFFPVFWQGDEGKTYSAKQYKLLPSSPNAGQTAWNVSICYSGDFAGVPIPPQATGNCGCDFKSIPGLEVN